jgi:hypothetical protein
LQGKIRSDGYQRHDEPDQTFAQYGQSHAEPGKVHPSAAPSFVRSIRQSYQQAAQCQRREARKSHVERRHVAGKDIARATAQN